MPPAIHNRMTVSAVGFILLPVRLQPESMLAIGAPAASAARVAAEPVFKKSLLFQVVAMIVSPCKISKSIEIPEQASMPKPGPEYFPHCVWGRWSIPISLFLLARSEEHTLAIQSIIRHT